MQFDRNLFQQINTSIQQSYQLQQQMLSHLGRNHSSHSPSPATIFDTLRNGLNSIQDDIVREWRPFYQQLITIVSRVTKMYSDKLIYLEDCLASARHENHQKTEQITVLKALLVKQTARTVSSSREGQRKSIKGTSQGQPSESTDKINISEYIAVLNQSLVRENATPSNRTLEFQPFKDQSQISKKRSTGLEDYNYSLQLKTKESSDNPGELFLALRETNNSREIDVSGKIERRGSSQCRKQGQQNTKRIPSPLSKVQANDSLLKVLKAKDDEWQGSKLQIFRKSLFQRRRSQR